LKPEKPSIEDIGSELSFKVDLEKVLGMQILFGNNTLMSPINSPRQRASSIELPGKKIECIDTTENKFMDLDRCKFCLRVT
jgi:hypothetical protein